MSQQTLDALERALVEHLKDEDDTDHVEHWVIISAGVSFNEDSQDLVMMTTPVTQSRYITIGLLEATQIILRAETYDAVINGGDDDDL
jgi:aspartyl-tRNA synthetase